jgi:hypothetical protein
MIHMRHVCSPCSLSPWWRSLPEIFRSWPKRETVAVAICSPNKYVVKNDLILEMAREWTGCVIFSRGHGKMLSHTCVSTVFCYSRVPNARAWNNHSLYVFARELQKSQTIFISEFAWQLVLLSRLVLRMRSFFSWLTSIVKAGQFVFACSRVRVGMRRAN